MNQEEIKTQLQQLSQTEYNFSYHAFDMIKDLNVDVTNENMQKTVALGVGEFFAEKLLASCRDHDFALDRLKAQFDDSPKPRFSTITQKLVESVLCLDKEYLALALHTFKDKLEEKTTIYNTQSNNEKKLTLSLYHHDVYNKNGQHDTQKNTQNGHYITQEYRDIFVESIKSALKSSSLDENEKKEKQRVIVNTITDFDRVSQLDLKQNITNVRQKMANTDTNENNNGVLKNKNSL
jgi:hypothetical protein